MKRIVTLCCLLVGLMGLAQDVETMLTEKIKVLDKSYKTPELQPLANDFERVALAAPTNWLANYYTAYVNIRIADLSQGDVIDTYCNQAEKYLKIAEGLNDADVSEINALYAYLYSTKVKVNPMFRGSKYGKISKEYIDKAIKTNADNPRPYVIRAIGIFFTPKVFGGGAEKAKPFLDRATQKYEVFTPKTPNHPHWGKGMVDSIKKLASEN